MEPNADKSATDGMEIRRKERQEMRNGQSGILVASIRVVGHRAAVKVRVVGSCGAMSSRIWLYSCIPRNPASII